MPAGTCDPASRGQAYNEVAEEIPLPDGSGSVLITGRWDWDGVSVMPDCNGPITQLRTRNTGTSPAWALLPAKKKGNPWVQIDPGTDVTTTNRTVLTNLGVSNYVDVLGLGFWFSDPAVSPPAASVKA